nr:MAG TPA: hypothetical protein [Crassvirales sp.]
METWCRWLLHGSLKNCRLVVQFPESPHNAPVVELEYTLTSKVRA